MKGTYRAFDCEILSTEDSRAYRDEVFAPDLSARRLEVHHLEHVDELVERELVPAYG